MRKGGGKQKGALFERLVCKQLSLYYSDGRRDDLFWRSAMSGGRATLNKGKAKNQAGDITGIGGHTFLHDVFLELKHYKSLDLAGFCLFGTGKLQKFWDTALKQARDAGKRHTLLIAKENRLPAIVIASPGWLSDPDQPKDRRAIIDGCDVYLFDELFPKPKRSKPRIK